MGVNGHLAAELPRIRLHDLRHTHATLALQAGVHPKVVTERLGHTSIAVTADFYTHVPPAIQRVAVQRFEGWLLGDEKGTQKVHSE